MFPMYLSVCSPGNTLASSHPNTCSTPFQLIGELGITGGDPKKVGYYVGELQLRLAARALNSEPSD